MPQDRIDPNSINWTGPAAQKQDIETRKDEASIGSSQASAASSAASAARTRTLTPLQARKEAALATKAELDAEKLKMAIEKSRAQISGRPAPPNLEAARRQVMVELEAAIKAKKLSREMFGATGFGHTFTSAYSGSPAASVASLLQPIQANAAFNKLQEMREKSPTGGALGAVSDTELKLLYSAEAPIAPTGDDEVFQKAMDTVIGNRIQVLSKLGANPYEIAAIIPKEDLPLYRERFAAYRFVPDDVKKISAYVDRSRKDGTFDPTDYAALVSEAYYNATGQQPDEAFITNAAQTGAKLAANPKSQLADFDYAPADEEIRARVLNENAPREAEERGWGGTLGAAAWNFFPSTFEFAADTVKALTVDLPDTIEGVAKVVGGAVGLTEDTEYEALKDYYKDRYGTMEGFKKALATDPASILADVAGIFTGGSTVLAKTAGLGAKVSKIGALSEAARAAEGFAAAASKLDPLAVGAKATNLGAKIATRAGDAALSIPARVAGVTGTDVKQAFSAGKRGSPEFIEQMRGTGDIMDPVAKAEAAVTELYQARSRDYTRRMAKMDKTETLDWTDVEKAIDDVEAVGKHKGIDISSAADVWQEIFDIADQFKAKGLNTIEDFDAMKRAMSTIASKYPVGTPQNKVARDVAGAVNKVIVQKAPVYANIMRDYRLASDTLADVKASVSLDAKSADTTLSKLQRSAAGRGPRGQTVLQLLESTKSGKGLGDMLAGQNLSGREPQGIAPSLSVPGAIAAGDPTVLSTALITPRGLGEKAYSLGSKYGAVERGVQAARGTAPVQRAEQLAAKYAPSLYKPVVAANPVIQSQVDPFTPPEQGMSDAQMAELMKRYGVRPPAAVLREPRRVSLEQLSAGYAAPRVSLRGLPLDEELPPEEEMVEGYARGGRVAAPLGGWR